MLHLHWKQIFNCMLQIFILSPTRFAFMSKMTDKQIKDNIYHLLASNTLWFTAYPAQMLPIASSETLAAGWPIGGGCRSVCVHSSSSCVQQMWLFFSWVIMVKVCSTITILKCMYFLVYAIGGSIFSFSATEKLLTSFQAVQARILNKTFTMNSSWQMEHMEIWLQLFQSILTCMQALSVLLTKLFFDARL